MQRHASKRECDATNREGDFYASAFRIAPFTTVHDFSCYVVSQVSVTR